MSERDNCKSVLIADAGGTSVGWGLVGDNEILRFDTEGINPVVTSERVIENIVGRVADMLDSTPDEVRFYGAGCRDESACRRVGDVIARQWPSATISVMSDLAGAATALFADGEGIACILGTGSNSGVWSGGEIIMNTPPMGYILGDEGSGAALGRAYLNALFKHRFAPAVEREGLDRLGMTLTEVIERVYRGEMPNRFLASMCPDIRQMCDEHGEVADMVAEQFKSFADNNLAPYGDEYSDWPLGFVGSVAVHFEHILRGALMRPISDVIADPLDAICRQIITA